MQLAQAAMLQSLATLGFLKSILKGRGICIRSMVRKFVTTASVYIAACATPQPYLSPYCLSHALSHKT